MQEIAELERRITAALERIGRGVESLGTGGLVSDAVGSSAGVQALNEALQEEQMANAQLSERLRVVHEKDAAEKAVVEAELAAANAQLATQAQELSRLRRTMAQLNSELSELRVVASEGVVEPEHINRAMLAELDALRTARASEAEELGDIVAALNPLIEEVRGNA